jgi:hypothetical protein
MNMSMDWLNNNSGGGDSVGVYFGTVGQKLIGVITGTPRQVSTQYGDRLAVDLTVSEGTTALKGNLGADGELVTGEAATLWVKPGAMASALKAALNEAGAKGLAEGDTLAVQFVEEQNTGKPSPLKVYRGQYIPAKTAVAVDSIV